MKRQAVDDAVIWNSRFVAYARSQGCTPKSVLTLDEKRWPGGLMTGFILWMNEQWTAWKSLQSPLRQDYARKFGWVLSEEDHANFDRWLEGK